MRISTKVEAHEKKRRKNMVPNANVIRKRKYINISHNKAKPTTGSILHRNIIYYQVTKQLHMSISIIV